VPSGRERGPFEFKIGEDAEDKPLKYPRMFRSCELVIINKIDLLEVLDFDIDRLEENIANVNPGAKIMRERQDRRGSRRVPRLVGVAASAGGGRRLKPSSATEHAAVALDVVDGLRRGNARRGGRPDHALAVAHEAEVA
jgi:G3E family GTPase